MAESKWTPWLPRLQHVLAVLLVVYLAWWVANLVWWVFDAPSSRVLTLPPQSGQEAQGNKSNVRPVAAYHLFGKEGARIVENKPRVTEAPKTRLRLVLKGVFTAEQGGESGAIVEEIGKGTDYYRLGDSLPGNATLEAVYDDRIMLLRNGILETLPFEDQKSSRGSMISVAPQSQQDEQEEAIRTPEQFLEEATQRLVANPEAALKSVGLAPGSDGGYVYQGNNPMLAGLNLKKGDVILSVNGHTLGDIQKDRELMKSLYEQGSLEVEVVRDGASFYINYPLR